MRHYSGIEGLRAWLAWTVVAWHLLQFFGVGPHGAAGIAATAVDVFIIVSGFVICNLVVTRPEAWHVYIVRRAFRIFPAYLLVLAASVGGTLLAAAAYRNLGWAQDPDFAFGALFLDTVKSTQDHPLAHTLLHLSLLHGAVSDSVLPHSSIAILGPAWSLSLEWQFYLIAPFFVLALSHRSARYVALAAAALFFVAFRSGWFGQYDLPSSLPAAGVLFTVGILSRLFFPMVAGLRRPLLWIFACLAFACLSAESRGIGLWGAFLIVMAAHSRGETAFDRTLIARTWQAAFESPLPRALGARSYSVYIVHWPLLQLCFALVSAHGGGGRLMSLAEVSLLTVPLTLLASEMLYRYVEQPFIVIGRGVAAAVALRTERFKTAVGRSLAGRPSGQAG